MSKNNTKLVISMLLCTGAHAIKNNRDTLEDLSPLLFLMAICAAALIYGNRTAIINFFSQLCSRDLHRESIQPVTPASSLQINTQGEPGQPLLTRSRAIAAYHGTLPRDDRHAHQHTGYNV